MTLANSLLSTTFNVITQTISPMIEEKQHHCMEIARMNLNIKCKALRIKARVLSVTSKEK